jgi:hypothetical protein
MSKNDYYEDTDNEKDDDKKYTLSAEDLKKFIPVTAFNIGGYLPSEVRWTESLSNVEKDVLNVAKGLISDVDCVSIIEIAKPIIDRKSGEIKKEGIVKVVVWFDHRCKHFWNKSTSNSELGKATSYFSKEIREFASKFGEVDKNKKGGKPSIEKCLTNPGDGNPNLVGVKVETLPFMQIIYDSNNKEYSKVMGNRFHKNCILETHWSYHKDSNKLIGLDIIKTLNKKGSKMNGAPTTIAGMRN